MDAWATKRRSVIDRGGVRAIIPLADPDPNGGMAAIGWETVPDCGRGCSLCEPEQAEHGVGGHGSLYTVRSMGTRAAIPSPTDASAGSGPPSCASPTGS